MRSHAVKALPQYLHTDTALWTRHCGARLWTRVNNAYDITPPTHETEDKTLDNVEKRLGSGFLAGATSTAGDSPHSAKSLQRNLWQTQSWTMHENEKEARTHTHTHSKNASIQTWTWKTMSVPHIPNTHNVNSMEYHILWGGRISEGGWIRSLSYTAFVWELILRTPHYENYGIYLKDSLEKQPVWKYIPEWQASWMRKPSFTINGEDFIIKYYCKITIGTHRVVSFPNITNILQHLCGKAENLKIRRPWKEVDLGDLFTWGVHLCKQNMNTAGWHISEFIATPLRRGRMSEITWEDVKAFGLADLVAIAI